MPDKKTWKHIRFVPFVRSSLATSGMMAFIHGLRSDGILFVLCIPLIGEDTPETVGLKVTKGFVCLDEYLSCDCIVGTPCKKHGIDFNPFAPEVKLGV